MTLHDIYPSSKVDPKEIAKFGWLFIESIPTVTNEHGRLAPVPERSQLHTELRAQIDKTGLGVYTDSAGQDIVVQDFALAEREQTPQCLGFFALI